MKKCQYEFCSKSFKSVKIWAKFCSKVCKMKDHWKNKINADMKKLRAK